MILLFIGFWYLVMLFSKVKNNVEDPSLFVTEESANVYLIKCLVNYGCLFYVIH